MLTGEAGPNLLQALAPHVTSLLVAVLFAVACGFRTLLPLFIASVLASYGLLEVRPGFEWLINRGTMVALGGAMMIELAAYAVPALDNVVDAIAVPATLLIASLSAFLLTPESVPALAAGGVAVAAGGAATGTAFTLAKIRLVSTTTTGGVGNLPLAAFEAVVALVLPVLAVFFLMGAVLAGSVIGLGLLWLQRFRRRTI